MKIFLDTADLGEIRRAASAGLIDGVTTNPSLVAKVAEGDVTDMYREICGAVDGPVSLEVLAVDREHGRLRVEKVRLQKRHLKPGRRGARSGGIIEQEGFIHASNVRLVDPKSGKPSRVRFEERDGARVRVFVKSGEPVPEPAQG